MRYWWVSHNQTFEHEVHGGFLWSPQTKPNGHRNYFYDTMEQASPGDIVFSFAKSHRKRRQRALGKFTPVEFEELHRLLEAA